MIVGYILKKLQEMKETCRSIQETIRFIEETPEAEIIENCRDIEESLVTSFLQSKETQDEERLLLAYFCEITGKQFPKFRTFSIRIFVEYFEKPFLTHEYSFKDFRVSPLCAYLGDKICDSLLVGEEPVVPVVQYGKLLAKANIIPSLGYLTASERRQRMRICYEKAYSIAKGLPPDKTSQAAHNYGNILYDIYFANPAYQDYPGQASQLFEEALTYRVKEDPTEEELINEVSTRVTYSANLRQNGDIHKAEKVMDGMLEKLERFHPRYKNEELYYKDYIECLNNILNIKEEKYEKSDSNILKNYLQKASEILTKITIEQIQIRSDSVKVFIANMMIRNVIPYETIEKLFLMVMPSDFFQAQRLVDSNPSNEQIRKVFEKSPSIHCYWILWQVTTAIFLEKVLLVAHQLNERLHISDEELRLAGAYGIFLIHNAQNETRGLKYCIYFLANYPLVEGNQEFSHSIYNLVLTELCHYFTERQKYNEISNILYLIQQLPWYSRQFRTIQSEPLRSLYKKLLELEICCYETSRSKNMKGELYRNVLSAWDNLTVDMEIIAKRLKIFYPHPHPVHSWEMIVSDIVYREKIDRELGGDKSGEQIEIALQNAQQIFMNLPEEFYDLYDKAFLHEFFGRPVTLEYLYQKEQHYFISVMNDDLIKQQGDFCFLKDSPFSDSGLHNPPQHYLQEILVKGYIISLSCITEVGKLISSVVLIKDGKITLMNLETEVEENDVRQIHQQKIQATACEKLIQHYQKLYAAIPDKSQRRLLWIGIDIMKFFPIHILTEAENASTRWLDTWKTIEFCPSLREVYFPIQSEQVAFYGSSKKIAPYMRFFGEKQENRFCPRLGNKIFVELTEIENNDLHVGCPWKSTPIEGYRDVFELQYLPRVFSYYGHIQYGHPLDPNTGFYSEGKISNFNRIICNTFRAGSHLAGTKRVELWGCQSASLASFASTELPRYEHFAERLLRCGVEKIVATLSNIPDLTAALICEHFSLNEKATNDPDIGALLKQAIQWYRKTIDFIRQQVEHSFCQWLRQNKERHWGEVDQEQPLFLKKVITEYLNQMRHEFHCSLPISFPMKLFSEEDIEKSMFSKEGAYFLGKNPINQTKVGLRTQQPEEYAKQWVQEIFSDYDAESAWGAVIFINTAIA